MEISRMSYAKLALALGLSLSIDVFSGQSAFSQTTQDNSIDNSRQDSNDVGAGILKNSSQSGRDDLNGGAGNTCSPGGTAQSNSAKNGSHQDSENVTKTTGSSALGFCDLTNNLNNKNSLESNPQQFLESNPKLNAALKSSLSNYSPNEVANALRNDLKLSNEQAQKLISTVQQANSQTLNQGDIGSKNPVSTTTSVVGDTNNHRFKTIVEGNNGIIPGDGNVNTFGRKFSFTVCAAYVESSDTAAVTPLQGGLYLGRNGGGISIPLVQSKKSGVAPTQDNLSMAILAVASRQGANCGNSNNAPSTNITNVTSSEAAALAAQKQKMEGSSSSEERLKNVK
jgi:hypothetical protein